VRTFLRAGYRRPAQRYVEATTRELLPPWAPLAALAVVLLLRAVAC